VVEKGCPALACGKPAPRQQTATTYSIAINSTATKPTSKIIFNLPTPFPYESDHAVPWKYGSRIDHITGKTTDARESSNITGAQKITRSGRVYGSKELEGTQNKTAPQESREEEEFLKIMKQSEYDIVDQLKKTPARISILSLILNSEVHKKALQKVLSEAYVQPEITPEKVVNMVDIAKIASSISFYDDEIVGTTRRQNALHITLKCFGYVISKVLIDGGSALNVLPASTLEQLPVDPTKVENSEMIVQAFDGTRREVIGMITLPLEIGPSKFEVEFQVMNIN